MAAKPLAALAGKVRLAVPGKFPMIPKGYSGLVQPLPVVPSRWWNYVELWGELWGIMGNYGGIMGNLGGIMGNYAEIWWNYGDLWRNYGEL